jgi:hypothetical protein
MRNLTWEACVLRRLRIPTRIGLGVARMRDNAPMRSLTDDR